MPAAASDGRTFSEDPLCEAPVAFAAQSTPNLSFHCRDAHSELERRKGVVLPIIGASPDTWRWNAFGGVCSALWIIAARRRAGKHLEATCIRGYLLSLTRTQQW